MRREGGAGAGAGAGAWEDRVISARSTNYGLLSWSMELYGSICFRLLIQISYINKLTIIE